jgi:uncharacterized protein (DUF2141 family)
MGPQGGPKDLTPPKVASSTPAENGKNYTKKTVEIDFNKLVSVEKSYENVIISPPQKKPPIVKAYGSKVFVEIKDSLKKNTTYTIDFGNSIQDINEKNILKNYSFAFSTGNEIDSLSIMGTLLDAQTLNPVVGSLVGIYDAQDTKFTSAPFLRTTHTNENGQFWIKNVKDGKYRVFALKDLNANFYFDQTGEAIAFMDSSVTPFFLPKPIIKKDSVTSKKNTTQTKKTKDTDAKKDTVKTKIDSTMIQCQKMVLFQFKELTKPQYFIKAERKEKEKFTLYFSAPLTEYPSIKPLNFDFDNKYLPEGRIGKDTTITYWLTDASLMKKDTLHFILNYRKTDSIGNLVMTKDTIQLTLRGEQKPQQKNKSFFDKLLRKDNAAKKVDYMKSTANIENGILELYNNPFLKFEAPVKKVNINKIHLFQKVDTLWKAMAYEFKQVNKIGKEYELFADFDGGKSYKIQLDSAAVVSIYDKYTEKKTLVFKVRPIEEYSTLKIGLNPFDERCVIQLLNNKDEVVAQEKAQENGTTFEYLNPGEYYVRLFIDENRNGKWDAGKYRENRQAEKMYYFNKKMSLKANWEVEENWDYKSTPVLKQKPIDLKPKKTVSQ